MGSIARDVARRKEIKLLCAVPVSDDYSLLWLLDFIRKRKKYKRKYNALKSILGGRRD